MKVGDYVSFDTYHSSERELIRTRRGIIIGVVVRGGRSAYLISSGKETFKFVDRCHIRLLSRT